MRHVAIDPSTGCVLRTATSAEVAEYERVNGRNRPADRGRAFWEGVIVSGPFPVLVDTEGLASSAGRFVPAFVVDYTPACDACGRSMTSEDDRDQILCSSCRGHRRSQ